MQNEIGTRVMHSILSTCLLLTSALAAHAQSCPSCDPLVITKPPVGVSVCCDDLPESSELLKIVRITIEAVGAFNGTVTIDGNGSSTEIREVIVKHPGGVGSELRLRFEDIDRLCAITRDATAGNGRYVIEKLQTTSLGNQVLGINYDIYAHDIVDIDVTFNAYATMRILPDEIGNGPARIFDYFNLAGGSRIHFFNDYGPIETITFSNLGADDAELVGLVLKDLNSGGPVKNAIFGDPDDLNPVMEIVGVAISKSISHAVDSVMNEVKMINARTISDIEIGGDVDGQIMIADPLPTTPNGVNTQSLVIGDSLTDDSSITLPALGLTSQIVINENGGATATWAGDVDVGGSILVPGYINSASSLGGGSVGCVPFALHEEDCDPAPGTCVDRASAPTHLNPIVIRHYGPVIWTGATDPFKIERRAIGSTNSWIDQTACFSQDPDGSVDNLVLLTSDVLSGDSTGTLEAGFEYRVTLVQNGSNENILRCDVPGTPEVADHADVYIFSVGKESLGDANNDGTVKFNDITSVLGNWGTTDCLTEGDANRDGVVDGDDEDEVHANWLISYTSCTGPSSQSLIFPSECDRTMEEAIDAMGFASASEFSSWYATLSKKEQKLVMTGIDEWLECLR